MKTCPTCAEEVQDKAIKCKHCGKSLKKSRWGWWVLGVFIVLYAIGSNSKEQTTTESAPAQPQAQPSQEAITPQVVHPQISSAQRFGRFVAQPEQMVSLNGFRVFSNPKPNVYFIRTASESLEEAPKVLVYRGRLSNGYEFASQDVATYTGKIEYKMWDTETNKLLDVYSLE